MRGAGTYASLGVVDVTPVTYLPVLPWAFVGSENAAEAGVRQGPRHQTEETKLIPLPKQA